MFGASWLILRQAREAMRNGRLEEANRLLSQPTVRGHKRAYALQQEVIRAFLDRAEKHQRNEDLVQAWNDVQKAEALAPNDPLVGKFRGQLLRLGLAEVQSALEAGRPGRAGEAIARLRDRGVRPVEVQPYEDVVRNWLLAREAADGGEFVVALQTVDRIGKVLPGGNSGLSEFRAQLEARHQTFNKLISELHDARQQQRWREAVHLADQVLAVATQNADVRKIRAEAWGSLDPESTLPGQRSVHEDTPPVMESSGSPRRLLLWIDGVGGYLLCLSSRITLGQATGEAPVDVPLFADVSRMHATMSRDAEGYLIEAARPVLVNGKSQTRALLQPGDRVTLGNSCQFLFQQPAPISTSAKLQLVSGHRLPYAVDGVLLMADSLILGAGTQTHVMLPDRKENIVLFRHKDGIGIKCDGEFCIDGQRCKDRGVLGIQATASGPEFTLAIEPAGRV
jgi:hypothetical protein